MSWKVCTSHYCSSFCTGINVCLQNHHWLCTHYLNSLLQTYVPSRNLHSASERRIIVPSQRGTKLLSQTFSLTVPSWCNDLPNSIRAAESLAIFKKEAKNTYLPSLVDPLTLALSILIVFFLSVFFVFISLLCIYLTLALLFCFIQSTCFRYKKHLLHVLY